LKNRSRNFSKIVIPCDVSVTESIVDTLSQKWYVDCTVSIAEPAPATCVPEGTSDCIGGELVAETWRVMRCQSCHMSALPAVTVLLAPVLGGVMFHTGRKPTMKYSTGHLICDSRRSSAPSWFTRFSCSRYTRIRLKPMRLM
jgi:hypothetical protein